jgi:hypothetical protein
MLSSQESKRKGLMLTFCYDEFTYNSSKTIGDSGHERQWQQHAAVRAANTDIVEHLTLIAKIRLTISF